MVDDNVYITTKDEKFKQFSFERAYWSHDGYIEDANGYKRKDKPESKYVDQVGNWIGFKHLDLMIIWIVLKICFLCLLHLQQYSSKSYQSICCDKGTLSSILSDTVVKVLVSFPISSL